MVLKPRKKRPTCRKLKEYNMISKSRKAVIRAAASEARKAGSKAICELGENVENPMGVLMDFKQKALAVCENPEEEEYFELCYVYRSEKGAEEFALWSKGFWASFPEKEAEKWHEA